MFRIAWIVSSIIAGAGLALVSLPGAEPSARAQSGQPGICPEKLVAGQDSLLCYCPSEATATGSVWGDEVYTDDSAICRAALHAGAIGTGGGIVRVRQTGGQQSYPAVTRNSVASSAWGSWTRSIAFGDAGQAIDASETAESCPLNAAALPLGARLRCGCSAEAAGGSGVVWGSGPYTADSSVCGAARHAGMIGADGGEVSLRIAPGRSSYSGSNRNGVSSNNWGSYGTSVVFER